MKQRLTKKFVSMFLAVMMIVTSIPFSGLTAFAATADEIYDGLDAEFRSHQVGFFFSDESNDPQYDKISKTNKLTGSGATWDSVEGGFKFNGDNADHLYIKASDILSKVTAETGFTIHFEAKSLSYDWQRYFDFMCSEPRGTGDTFYLCATPNGGGKVCVKHSNGADGYDEMEQIGGMNTSDGQWHTYTIAVSNSTVEVWVDGKAYASKQDGLIDSAWFNQMRDNGYIRFGISAFSADPAYDGWLKNVHVYDVAYTEPAYLFAYFTGDDDQADAVNQRIRFALSKDGVNFTSINGNAPILKNDQVSGTITWNNKTGMAHTKGVRDPFIIKKVNEAGYFVVATDLRVGANGGSYNNSKIVVWDINDLSKADKAIPWVVETSGMFGSSYYSGSTINKDYIAWAPEVTYDYQNNIYMMYWSGPLYSNSTILCAYTHDFKTFYQDPQATKTIDGNTYKPKTLFSESGKNVIDADIVFDGSNYYMVYKRESEKQLYFVKASTIEGITSQNGTRFYDSRFTGAVQGGNGEGLEGPELYKNAAGKWTLIADNYTANTGAGSKGIFYMYQVDSLDEFMTGADCSSKSVSTNISDCSPRHGSVTTISSGVFASLNKEYGGVSDAKGALVARYFTSSDTKADTSGNGYNMEFPNGGVSYVSEFNGVKNCVHFDASTSNRAATNPLYAKVSTAQMMADYNFNYYDGLTMTWKAYDEGNDVNGYSGFFTLTQTPKATPGVMPEDTTNYTHYDTAYAFLLAGLCRGVSSGTPGASNGTTVYASKPITGQWVDYKLVITGKGYKVYRNGEIAVDNNNERCEMSVDSINQQWYLDLFTNGTLLLGTTLFNTKDGGDLNYKGYMADFRIYATGNQDSVAELEKEVAKDDIRKEFEIAKANLNADTANNAKAETFNAKGYYGSNEATDGTGKAYSNILYCSKNISSPSEAINQGYCDWKFLFPSKVVMIYDGVNKVSSPIVLSVVRHTINKSPGYAEINDSDFGSKVELRGNWKGYNTDGSWPYNNTNTTISYTSSNYWAADKLNSTTRYFGNILYYKALGNTDTYYDNVYKLDFHVSNGAGNDGTHSENKYRASFNNYYINYKPIYNILTKANDANVTVKETGKSYNFTDLYNEVYPNQWMYTDETVQAYLVAVNRIASINLKSTFSDANDSNVDAKVKASAFAIKEAYESYKAAAAALKKKTINVDFTFADGSVVSKTIAAGAKLDGIIPANTKAVYNNNKLSHMNYTWSEGCEASHMPTEDEAYFEVFATNECSFDQNTTTAPTCEGTGLATFTCKVCGGKYNGTVPALGHDWGTGVSNGDGTHKQTCSRDNTHKQDLPCDMVENAEGTEATCSECGYTKKIIKLNRTAYNNAVDAAKSVILNETAKYSADSLKALQAVLNQAATDSLNVETQEALDAITATIITANKTTVNGGVLVANTFRITYGNLFDYNEFMNSDSKNISNPEWGTIDFDIANQVFTVIGNGTYNDVYSAYNGAGTYKIPVSDSTSYTFEFTAKGTTANQAFVFFYNENGTALNVGENFKYTYNGTEKTAGSSEYFVNHYGTPDGGTTKLTFTPPAGTVKVDFRFGLTLGTESCDFYNIGFYETSKADNFIVADNVEYGTDFGAIAISTPDVDGMHFGGWFIDKECTTSVTTIGEVTENINLYAKLHPYVVKEEVGCTLINNGYTVYVCSGDCADSEMTAYDDKLLDGTTNGYWDAYNNLVALVTAEESNGYANYTKASVDAVKKAYTDLHTTACASHKQAEVDGYANEMKAIINQLVVKVNFVTKGNGGVDKTETKEVQYNGALDIFNVNTPQNYTTVDGRYTWTFSGWDKQIVTSNITTGATYTAQYTRKDNADLTAYNAAVALAEASIANTAKYTLTSRNELQALLDNNTIKEDTTQAEINAKTEAIVSANKLIVDKGILVLEKYTVTFTYVNTEGNEITEINAVEYEYGASVDLTVPDEAGQVYKWNKRIGSADKKIAGSTNHITHIVSGNVTISAYTVQQKKPDTQYCVTVYNRINKVIGYFYVNKDTPVSFDGPTITVGDNSLTVEKTPYYQIDGFMCNGQPIGTGFTVTSDVKIYPIYLAEEEIEIKLNNNNGNAQIRFDDGTTETKKALWDQKVTVKADSEVTWYVNDVAVAKGNEYTFRATKSITIKAVADATETGSSIITYANFDSENRKARIAVSSYSSDTKVIKEQGLIILTSTSASELSYDDIKNNGKKYKATNTTSEKNQFSFTLNVSQSSSIKTFGIISYVIYENDGTPYYSTECKNINVN